MASPISSIIPNCNVGNSGGLNYIDCFAKQKNAELLQEKFIE
jgi:hypothetical protein